MNKYLISFYDFWANLLPPNKRIKTFISFGKVIMSQIQWLHTNLFVKYYKGETLTYWNATTIYSKGVYIKGQDKAIYYCISTAPMGTSVYDTNYWLAINSSFIGSETRLKFTSQKSIFEYALNTWFDQTFINPPFQLSLNSVSLSPINITTNSIDIDIFLVGNISQDTSNVSATGYDSSYYIGLAPTSYLNNDFTINYLNTIVPSYLTIVQFEEQIKAFADKINLAGLKYNIISY
jgi:hypothetical protein